MTKATKPQTTTKHAGGRPTKYDSKYCEQAKKLCLLGATDIEIADFFGVNERTLNNWKKSHLEFLQSLKSGKMIADAEVASKLYHRAVGYEHPEVDIKMYEGKIIKTKLVKHYPPDTAANIFWLKNRQPEKWRDKHNHELTGKDGKDLIPARILSKEEAKELMQTLKDEY